MNKICTSIEQSNKLIELEIDVNTADMCYCPMMNIDSGKNEGYLEVPECYSFSEVKDFLVPYLPAWSLTALLKLMPKSTISTPNPFCDIYCCRNIEFDMEFYAGNPVDAAFEMVCWLLENKVNYMPVDYKNNK